MSHAMHQPDLFVCTECNAVYAGDHERVDGETHYTAPTSCSACGAEGAFVKSGTFAGH